jgi:hypothetical protein
MRMDVQFWKQAQQIEDEMYARASREYERLWELLDRIRNDPEAARHARWSQYVSTYSLWGSHIPGTEFTVYWRVESHAFLTVALIARDLGV